jgi:putative ABC transport system substrate-binding protein
MILIRTFAVVPVAALWAILAPISSAEAQTAARVPVIGYLAQRAGPWHLDKAFVDGLRELGYFEGRNIAIEYRWGENTADLPAMAADLARLKVDVIVSSGCPANKAARGRRAPFPS